MARLTESQLAGFRVGTNPPGTEVARPGPRSKEPPREATTQEPRADQSALALEPNTLSTSSPLDPVPAAPTRGEARHKIGLTLPLDLAEYVRTLTRQGYALADLIMVAYQDHRDDLVGEHEARTTRQLERRKVGRMSFTVTLSAAERDALDALAKHLDTTRSQTVAALIECHLHQAHTPPATAAPPPAPRSNA